MSIDAEARRRWHENRIGDVPVLSWRGMVGVFLVAVALVAVLATPAIELVDLARGKGAGADQTITRDLLVLNMAFNAAVLMFIPMLVIAVTHPERAGAVVRRLRLAVDERTPVYVAAGIGVTLAALMALGAILYALDKAGIYTAKESGLVPQIRALLTWPVVIALPLVAAFTEETFFRGFLQPRIGLVLSSLLFGLVHIGYGTVLQVVAPVLLGLLFGGLFQRTKSLWSVIAAHFTFDFIELLLLFLDKSA